MDLGCNPASVPMCQAADVIATDDCGVPTVICASVDGPLIGCVHYRTNAYTAIDSCDNRATCRQVLRWTEDTMPPVFLSCPADVDLGCNPASIPACNAGDARVLDDCGIATVTCASVDGATVGRVHYRTNIYTATDTCKHSAACQQVLTWREDTSPPMFLICPADVELGCNPTNIPACNATDAVATDDGDAATVTCLSFDGPVLGCVHYRTNLYVASDACSNSVTCQQVLSWKEDVLPPVFTLCPADADLGCNPASIPACSPSDAMAIDDCGVPVIACTSFDGLVMDCVHYRTNVYTATDLCDNRATCQQVLKWREDTVAPMFTVCPADLDLGRNPASIPACNASDAVAIDDCGVAALTCTSFEGPVADCVRYRTNVYTATDVCDNRVTCRQVLRWTEDTSPPTFITCPADVDLGCNPAVIPACNVADVEAIDDCGLPTVICASVDGLVSGCVHYRTNIYTAVDASSNSASCRQVLSWTEDTAPPVFAICPADVDLGCLGAGPRTGILGCNAADAVAIDGCGMVTVTCAGFDGLVVEGVHYRTNVYTATDVCGNAATCRQTFRWMQDDELPVIHCPSDIVGEPDKDQCSRSNVTYMATVTDNCPDVMVVCIPSSGSTFVLGTNTVICTAIDSVSNTVDCSFRVIINDPFPPVLHCPLDIVSEADADECSKSNVTFNATAIDNCPGVTLICSPPSGSTFALGTNTVICVATDASSNTNGCSFTIVVVDRTGAVLTVVREGDAVMICWPLACTRFLQETSDLNPPIHWVPVDAPVSVVGDKHCVTLGLDSANRFFSLSGD
jgi:HYR domain-containing protein